MERIIRYVALAQRVLAVAVINFGDDDCNELFDWAVYIDAIPGINHNQEFMAVASLGSKQSKKLASILFPGLDIQKYRG